MFAKPFSCFPGFIQGPYKTLKFIKIYEIPGTSQGKRKVVRLGVANGKRPDGRENPGPCGRHHLLREIANYVC
jgi:hypothetical protein